MEETTDRREEFKEKIRLEITACMEQLLDFIRVAVPESNWKPMRSKTLRLFNDLIRKLTAPTNEKEE